MRSIFGSLEIAKRGLSAQQQALDLVGRNVANANTRGYSRQEASFSTAEPYNVLMGNGQVGQIGQGVDRVFVARYRDQFLDKQYREKNGNAGYYQIRSQTIDQIDKMFSEPSQRGLRAQFSSFWDAITALADRPNQNDSDARVSVIQTALALASTFNEMGHQLSQMRTNSIEELRVTITNVNALTNEVANLNKAISEGLMARGNVNHLMDRRDLLVDELSRLVGATTSGPNELGQIEVFIGGVAAVSRNESQAIRFELDADDNPVLSWAKSGMPVQAPGGEVKGLMQLVRPGDGDIARYHDSLNMLAQVFAEEINRVHRDGATNPIDFFDVTYPANGLRVNPELEADPSKLRTGATGDGDEPGDNSTVLKMQALRTMLHTFPMPNAVGLEEATFDGFLEATMARLGVDGQETLRRSDAYTLQRDTVDAQRMNMSGVDPDEEMTKLIQYQHAYAAAARVITTLDEALSTVISGMGVVGR